MQALDIFFWGIVAFVGLIFVGILVLLIQVFRGAARPRPEGGWHGSSESGAGTSSWWAADAASGSGNCDSGSSSDSGSCSDSGGGGGGGD